MKGTASLKAASVTTVTGASPAGPGGEVAVSWLSEMIAWAVAGVAPNRTSFVFDRPAPLMETAVPPAVEPKAGVIVDIIGGASKVKVSELLVPPVEVTVIGTVPIACEGVVTSTSESDTTFIAVPGMVPNSTLVVPVRPLPVIATCVPPLMRSADGSTAVGAGPAM